MNRTILFILTAIAAILFAACGAPSGNNTPANNANNIAAKPIAAEPTADGLLALDKQANEAFMKGDAKFFEGMLSDKFVTLGPGGSRLDKAEALGTVAANKCDLKDWKLDEPQMSKVDPDTYVLTYKGTFDGTCTWEGKTEKAPSPVRAATVWVRSGDKWLAAFHGENLIIDPKAPTAPAAGKDDPKKEKSTANSNTPTNAVERVTADADTEALMKVELAVWEAWKAGNAKKLEESTASDLAFVDIFGTVTSTKADTIKLWTEHRCDVKSVSVTDGVGTSLSPAVSILTFKGTADGTCYGQKIGGPIYGTSVYVKSGNAWKAAFTLNSPD